MHLAYGQLGNTSHGCNLETKRIFRSTEELLLPLVKPTWLLGHLGNFRGVKPFAYLSSQRIFLLQHDSDKVQFLNRKHSLLLGASYVESHIQNWYV